MNTIEAFKSIYKSVNEKSVPLALNDGKEEYVFNLIMDKSLSSTDRATIFQFCANTFSDTLMTFTIKRLNDENEYIRSIAIENIINYGINGKVDKKQAEDLIYPIIRDEKNEELKNHLSILFEYL